MVVFAALASGVVAGLFCGGNLHGLSRARLRGEAVLLGALAIQIVLPLVRLTGGGGSVAKVVWLVTFPAMLGVAVLNLPKPGMSVVASGLILNTVIVFANGAMPVSADAYRVVAGERSLLAIGTGDVAHSVMTSRTLVPALGDVLPLPGPFAAVSSVGDVLLLVGVAAFVCGSMLALEGDSPIPE